MRLIDANALKAKMPTIEDEYKYAHKLIDDAPTVDAVPVIRCKDCRFSHITLDGRYNKWCDIFTDDDDNPIELNVESDFYCKGARRKEE